MMPTDHLDLPPSRAVSVIRAAQCTPVRWRNGGGFTLEIATWPEHATLDTFLWRVSVATIDAPGPFSRFPGIDRSLTLIDGDAMVLQETALLRADPASASGSEEPKATLPGGEIHAETRAGAPRDHHLTLWDSLRFPGEADVMSRLPNGPTRDFNLMWRRGRGYGVVDVLHDADQRTVLPGSTVFYCARGGYHVDDVVLEPGDTYVTHTAQRHTLSLAPRGGDAALVCAHIALSLPGDSSTLERGIE